MAKIRKTAPEFGGKTQTESYYWNRKTAQKPHEKWAQTAKPHEKIGENRKTANLWHPPLKVVKLFKSRKT